jgi:hypothetical protein
MPPNGYSTVTISDETSEKLAIVMAEHDKDSFSEAIEYAVDAVLAGENQLDEPELAHILYERLQDKHKT